MLFWKQWLLQVMQLVLPGGYIYVRAEYPIAVERLNIAIKQAREYGLLGKRTFSIQDLILILISDLVQVLSSVVRKQPS